MPDQEFEKLANDYKKFSNFMNEAGNKNAMKK